MTPLHRPRRNAPGRPKEPTTLTGWRRLVTAAIKARQPLKLRWAACRCRTIARELSDPVDRIDYLFLSVKADSHSEHIRTQLTLESVGASPKKAE